MATLTVPPGWYTDPSGRHEYRYWDGTNWTPGVSDHGVSSTDAPEMRPPPPVDVAAMRPSATSEPALEATAFARAYRAVAVPSRRVLAVQVATAGALVALLFEMIASLMLAAQVSNSLTVPTRSTLEWWSWLYDSSPVTSAYSYIATYPPVGLWPALLLAAILLSLLPLTAVQALRKAGLRAAFRWSAPSERARLAHGLAELGCSNTLFRARGRRGLLVFSTLASLAVITMSGYALIAKQALFQDSGTLTATNLPEAGVGPVVCLLGGVVALVGGLLAWPWSREQHVLVHLDGTIRPEQESGFGLPVTNVAQAATIPQPEQPAATLPSTLVASPTALAATPEPHAPPGRPRRWVVPLIAVVAALGLIVGLVIWAPWANKAAAPSPVGLKAGPATVSSVAFQWSRPATDQTPDRYLVLRDGTQIGSVPGTVTSYRATGLAPATAYRFSVLADWGDRRSPPSTDLVVKTLTPPVSAARLTGTSDVNVKIVKSPGGKSSFTVGETSTETWVFTPKCASGPCAVVVSGDLWSHPFDATLTRAGAVYTGTVRAHITHCGPVATATDVKNTVSLRLTVRTAGVDTGAWTARSWIGSLVVSSPYTSAGLYYCPAQSVTASLAASG